MSSAASSLRTAYNGLLERTTFDVGEEIRKFFVSRHAMRCGGAENRRSGMSPTLSGAIFECVRMLAKKPRLRAICPQIGLAEKDLAEFILTKMVQRINVSSLCNLEEDPTSFRLHA